MSFDIERISQLFQATKSVDMLEKHGILEFKNILVYQRISVNPLNYESGRMIEI